MTTETRATALELAEGVSYEVSAIYDRAARLVALAGEAGGDRDELEHGDEDDSALDDLADIALTLSGFSSSGLEQVVRKIAVWRALAPEELLCVDTAPTDGKLLLSILSDVTALAERE